MTKAQRFAMGTLLLAGAFHVFADSDARVPYSGGVSKMGFHHYYANDKAMEGFSTGKFPDGSVIVDERLEVEQCGGGSFEG